VKTELRSRLFAVSLLAATLVTLWALVISPLVRAYADAEQGVAETDDRLVRLRRVAAARPALERELAALRVQSSSGQFALRGPNAQLAAAEMQDRLKRLIESSGATMKSTQVLPGRDEKGFRRIALRVTMDGDTDALQKIFYGVETATPLMFIDNIEVRSRGVQTATAGRRGIAELTVAYDVYGFHKIASP